MAFLVSFCGWRRRWLALGALVLCAGVGGRAQVVTETFRNSTAPGWVFSGVNFAPTLTSGGADPNGDGWLRLTSVGNNQATSAYFDSAFTAKNATIYASFEFQSWGGNGADGFTFFLFDGSRQFSVGANGGSLGYAQKTNTPGLAGGYLGVAVDEFGNFSNPTEGRIGGPGYTPDSFAVRGPGDGTSGYDYLGGTGSLPTSIDSPFGVVRPRTFNQVQLLITPTNQLTLTLQQGGTSPQTVLALDLSDYARPDTLKFGFSSGTGSQTNFHEIRNLNISALVAALWDGQAGNGQWGTAANWDPDAVPLPGTDILFTNTSITSPQTVDTGTDRTVRTINFDSAAGYTINNNTLTFDSGAIGGFSGVIVSSSAGAGQHTINSDVVAANDITFRTSAPSALTLNGSIDLGTHTLTVDGTGTTTLGGAISGNGGLVKNDAGTVILDGPNSYTGGTTVSNGVVAVSDDHALGTGNVTLAGGAITSASHDFFANNFTLTGNSALSGLTILGNLTVGGSLVPIGGDRTLALHDVTLAGQVTLGDSNFPRTLTLEVANGESTVSGAIVNSGTGVGSVTKTGAGTLVLAGNNTYTGTTRIVDGTIRLAADNRIGDASNITISAAGTLDLAGHSDRVGNLTAGGGATLDFGAAPGANTFVFDTYTPPSSGLLVVRNWDILTDQLATTVAGQNVGSIYFSGLGAAREQTTTTATLYGPAFLLRPIFPSGVVWDGEASNTWNNGVNWEGDLRPSATQVAIFDSLGSGRNEVNLDANQTVAGLRFDSSATANYTLSSATGNVVTLTGNVPFIQQFTNLTTTINHGIALSNTTVVDILGSGDLVLAGNLTVSSRANLVRDGAGTGTLILSGNNTYRQLSVNTGAVEIRSDRALGSQFATVAAGASLEASGNITVANDLILSGAGVGGAGALRSLSGNNTFSGVVTLGANTRIAADAGRLFLTNNVGGTGRSLDLAGSGDITLSGAVSLGTGTLTVGTTGTVTLSGTGANTFANAVVDSGTLVLARTGGSAFAGNLTVGDGVGVDRVVALSSNQFLDTARINLASSGVLELTGTTQGVSSINGAAGSTVALGTGSLIVWGGSDSALAGNITGGAGSSLIKYGDSRLGLSGSNSGFAGNVVVGGGVLSAIGPAAHVLGTGGVAVEGGATLSVEGGVDVANHITLRSSGADSGRIDNAAGHNTFSGAVTLSGNGRIQSEAGQLSLTGNVALNANTLTLGGASDIAIAGAISGAGQIVKEGTGTTVLWGANTYLGPTTINGGTLALGADNVFADRQVIHVGAQGELALRGFDDTIGSLNGAGVVSFGLGGSSLRLSDGNSMFAGQFTGTGELIIGPGTTFTLGANFANLNLRIVLDGGTLNLNGFTGSIGQLSVTGNSTIDFGAGLGSRFEVAGLDFADSTFQLGIENWNEGVDFFGARADPGPRGSPPMNQVVFNGFTGADTRWQPFDRQITPVPEPAETGAGLLGMGVLLLAWRRWRQRRGGRS